MCNLSIHVLGSKRKDFFGMPELKKQAWIDFLCNDLNSVRE